MIKLALCQTKVFLNKELSIKNALDRIQEAADNGAVIAALPEMFSCPYGNEYFKDYSETENESVTLRLLTKICKKNRLYLIAGSIPEREGENIYNTSYIISPEGELISKHRKLHMFDVNIQNGTYFSFQESLVITRGEAVTVFDTIYGKMGLCICYDVRFPELFSKMTALGAKVIFVPAAFSSTTGPKHWELLLRSRAMDNQIYVGGISPSVDSEGGFRPYGNTMLTNPWGEVVAKAPAAETIIYGDLDFDYLQKIRNELPLLKHKRPELYK